MVEASHLKIYSDKKIIIIYGNVELCRVLSLYIEQDFFLQKVNRQNILQALSLHCPLISLSLWQ